MNIHSHCTAFVTGCNNNNNDKGKQKEILNTKREEMHVVVFTSLFSLVLFIVWKQFNSVVKIQKILARLQWLYRYLLLCVVS